MRSSIFSRWMWVLVLAILPTLLSVISPDLSQQLITGSTLYTFASQFDLLNAMDMIGMLVRG